MPGEDDHAKRRRATLEEIERNRLKLVTLGAQVGAAVEGSSADLFDLLDDALSMRPTRVLQSGVIYWVGAYRAQVNMLQGMWRTLTEVPPPPRERSRMIGDRIVFFLDQYSQASDPVLTDIPVTETVRATELRIGRDIPDLIPADFVTFSRPSDGGGTYVISLTGLGTLMMGLLPGTYHGQVSWRIGQRAQRRIIEAVVSRSSD